jgi:hypothetical protein
VITTGTPPGDGLGQKPPFYLKAGDTMRLGIEKLGEQSQSVIAWRPQAAATQAATGVNASLIFWLASKDRSFASS